jgi:2'-5' RNA ligase
MQREPRLTLVLGGIMVGMALAVCLLFDSAGDRLVRQLWARLEAQGVATLLTHTHRRHRPHLSLAVARSWDLEEVIRALEPVPFGDALQLSLPGIVAFTRGRASLAAGVNADLARRQQSVAEAVEASGADLHYNYEPGRWVPHVSLATGGSASQLPVISNVVNDALPLTISVASAALIDSGSGQTWLVPTLR